MLIDFRKILILIAVCSLPTNDVLAQKGKRKVNSKKQNSENIANTPKAPKFEEAKPIPKAPVDEGAIDEFGLKKEVPTGEAKPIPKGERELENPQISKRWFSSGPKESREDILMYFINEAEKNLSFKDANGGKATKIPLDSLLPQCKAFITWFVERYNANDYVQFSQYPKDVLHKNIYLQILNEKKKKYTDRDSTILKLIMDSINSLPVSQEKIGLLLDCGDLTINKQNYFYRDVDAVYSNAINNANHLPSFYEKGLAYSSIADFAGYNMLGDSAVKLYYLAMEYFENANIPTQTKDKEKGLVFQKLADLFSKIGLDPANIETLKHLQEAEFYFDIADLNYNRDLCILKTINIYAFFATDLSSEYNAYFEYGDLEALYSLKKIYTEKKSEGITDRETDYLVFRSIGTILRGENRVQEALYYYFRAFFCAAVRNDKEDMGEILDFISFSYALIGNRNAVKVYTDLTSFFAQGINDKGGYYNNCFAKADCYYQLGNFDSALTFLDRIQFDSIAANYFSVRSYGRLVKAVSRFKYKVFDSLRVNKDSIHYYERAYLNYEVEDWGYYSSLLAAEYNANSNLLENIRLTQVEGQRQQIKLLYNEKQKFLDINTSLKNEGVHLKNLVNTYSDSLLIKERAIKKLDSLTKFYALLAKENKKEAEKYKDSAQAAKDSALKYRASVKIAKDSANKYREEARVAEGDRNKANKYFMLSIGLAALTLIAFFLFYRQKIAKQVKQNNLLKAEAVSLIAETIILKSETKDLKSIIEANNEAFDSDLKYENEKILKEYTLKHEIVSILKNLEASFYSFGSDIRDNDVTLKNSFSILKEKLAKLSSFASAYYMSLQNEGYNSVDSEVQLASEYVGFVKIKTNGTDIFFTDNRRYENLKHVLPHHSINSLVKNSIEKGKKPNEPIHISVADRFEGNTYILEIADDGVGVGESFDSKAIHTDGTGIKNLRKQVAFYNTQKNNNYTIELNKNFICDRKKVDGKSGTIVTLRIKQKHESN